MARESELREAVPGQQHWVSVNLGVFQPTTVRAAFKAWPRSQGSVWVEAYAGSVLVHAMYGFGVRMQYTACTFRNGDQLMISPGVGVHILPNWVIWNAHTPHYGWGWGGYPDPYRSNTLYDVAGAVTSHGCTTSARTSGFEIGLPLGLAGRCRGTPARTTRRR